ncbi:OmpH family outer membrane protein [Chitinophaga silvatica]|uniref:OmpH family outer membrane protein n=1 Tax=Chitinophaga silvatica TaxID=2282649 RepID=A0A3E1Y7N4_9BACT|nr:OmpH family outer membrane protein [Chitinophaga silvatica]RFS21033.1 OmpH family outer membrane protein [Chitinophaga silvatica]
MRTRKQIVTTGFLAVTAAGLLMSCQGNKTGGSTTAPTSNATNNASAQGGFKIAYVDLDSLEAHFEYFKEKRAILEQKQQQMDNQLKSKGRALQNEYEDLQRKAQANMLTQEQGEAAQRSLMTKQQQLEQEAQNLRAVYTEQETKFNEELQKKLDDFLKSFNSDKRFAYIFSYRTAASNILYKDESYDITADVIKGMNNSGTSTAK